MYFVLGKFGKRQEKPHVCFPISCIPHLPSNSLAQGSVLMRLWGEFYWVGHREDKLTNESVAECP